MTALPQISFRRFCDSVDRIVERQEDSATTRITADLVEQQMLEEMLVSQSARGAGKNVAVFDDNVFVSEPMNQRLWISQVRADRVMFRGKQGFMQFAVGEYQTHDGGFARIGF